MCISETSLVAIICCSLTVVASIINTVLTLRDRSKEKYKVKQEAILKALRFLDTYYSFLDYPNGVVPERDNSYDSTKMTIECRDCYASLCVSVKNGEILDEFLAIVVNENTRVSSLYRFRHLSRKELGLDDIHFNEESVFLSIISSRALRNKNVD